MVAIDATVISGPAGIPGCGLGMGSGSENQESARGSGAGKSVRDQVLNPLIPLPQLPRSGNIRYVQPIFDGSSASGVAAVGTETVETGEPGNQCNRRGGGEVADERTASKKMRAAGAAHGENG